MGFMWGSPSKWPDSLDGWILTCAAWCRIAPPSMVFSPETQVLPSSPRCCRRHLAILNWGSHHWFLVGVRGLETTWVDATVSSRIPQAEFLMILGFNLVRLQFEGNTEIQHYVAQMINGHGGFSSSSQKCSAGILHYHSRGTCICFLGVPALQKGHVCILDIQTKNNSFFFLS